jgi:hypothetical protein
MTRPEANKTRQSCGRKFKLSRGTSSNGRPCFHQLVDPASINAEQECEEDGIGSAVLKRKRKEMNEPPSSGLAVHQVFNVWPLGSGVNPRPRNVTGSLTNYCPVLNGDIDLALMDFIEYGIGFR